MSNTIPFTEEDIKGYLDRSIEYWREKRKESNTVYDVGHRLQAEHYIDAFQSVRISLFGKLLSEDKNE